MHRRHFTRAFFALTLFITALTLAIPPASAGTTSPIKRNTVSSYEYSVLLKKFTKAEIQEIKEISTQSEITELVNLIENPTGLTPKAFTPPEGIAVAAAPNGCTLSPDRWGRANFKPVCDRHDICYTSATNRKTCDSRFLSGLKSVCTKSYPNQKIRRGACLKIADTYYTAVRAAGSRFYKGSGRNN